MSRPLVVAALLLTLLFTLVVFAVRTQPYPSELDSLVTSDDCTAPCFMGIRPGVTTADDAVTLLESNLWVREVINHEDFSWPEVDWRWLSAAPFNFPMGERWVAGKLGVQAGVVQYIELRTNLSLGETWLTWGEPEWYSFLYRSFGLPGTGTPATSFIFVYRDGLILAPVRCPYLRRLWNAEVTIVLGNTNMWLERLIEGFAPKINQPLPHFLAETQTRRGFC